MESAKNLYGVIMAGGIGSRFWPMSTSNYPKQFHDVLGTGKTLIQQTFDRLKKLIPNENIYVITGAEYEELTLQQLPEMDSNNVITEPVGMNTAPCALYSALKIRKINSKGKMLLCPSDHLILNEDEFVKNIQIALNGINETKGIFTLGIEPSRPDTGYGYIQYEESDKPYKPVKTFTEKPQLEMAKKFLKSGDFLWNSGIFIWSVEKIIQEFETYLPGMTHLFEKEIDQLNTPNEKQTIQRIYPLLTKISIDNGIMEKTKDVYVIPSNFGWTDLGTWGSLYEQVKKDNQDNAIVANYSRFYNATNNMVYIENKEKAVVIDGLNDFIVVDTPNALLICPKDKDQEVKKYVNDLKLNKGERFT